MIPNSRQLLTDTRVPNSHRFSFSHQSDYQRIDDEAAAMAQQQRRFSSRFLPDAKRKSRPKSLPIANDCTLPRSKTNPLTRSLSALIQRFRRKPSTSKKSKTAIPLPVLRTTSVPCHQNVGSSSTSGISGSSLHSLCNDNNNNELPTSTKRNSMMSNITAHSIYSTFPCNDIEEDSEEHEQWSPRTSLISTEQMHHHPSDDLHMQSECILQQQNSVTTANQDHSRMTDCQSLHNNEETDSAIDMDSIREVADRLWDDDDTSICSLEERAEWLGTRFRAQVLKHYMSHFDFTNQRLDAAFRTLCGKLYFKAEAQQMDRILGAFASRYWECHSSIANVVPQRMFGSLDVVYAVAYAILLLNTDLHVAHQGKGRHKMSQSKFVRNTMATLRGLGFPPSCNTTTSISCFSLPMHFVSPSSSMQGTSLRASESTVSTLTSSNISCSTSSHISLWPLETSTSLTGSSSSVYHYPQHEESSSPSSSRRRRWTYNLDPRGGGVISSSKKKQRHRNIKRKSSVTPNQKVWMTEMEALLKDIYISIKTHPIAQMSPASMSSTSRSHHSSTHEIIHQQPGVKNSNARKEGLLTRKHVMESRDKKARQRGWQLCRAVVQEGNMHLYSASSSFALDDNERRHQRVRPRTLSTITHNYYRSFRSTSTQINLRHSLTTTMPYSSGCGPRPYVFCVKTADGAVWLFETLTAEAAHEWTQLCNYWAARLSKEPLDGAVCNLDYGWGVVSSPNNNTRIVVHEWNPPAPPSNISSSLSTLDQLAMLQRRITILEQELDQHRSFKDRIYQRFAGSHYNINQRKKALDNWESKAQYLIQQVIKMHTYHDTLLHYPST
ncbi:SEC7-like protein [Lichtheimia hyalospora FSU 10163]|nr:SEC7-like protein [Lichtheimia hyalospora FSU 10163]